MDRGPFAKNDEVISSYSEIRWTKRDLNNGGNIKELKRAERTDDAAKGT